MKKLCLIFFAALTAALSAASCAKDALPERDSHILFKNLRESFGDTKGETKYPPYYGGAYLNPKDSSLVVIVIGDTLRSKKELIKRCKGSNFYISYCEEQEEAIRRILHYLHQFRTNEKNQQIIDGLGFKSSCMSPEKRVSIQLLSFQEEKFRQLVLDSPFLDFEESIVVFE